MFCVGGGDDKLELLARVRYDLCVRVIKPVRANTVEFVNCELLTSRSWPDPNPRTVAKELKLHDGAGGRLWSLAMRKAHPVVCGSTGVTEGLGVDATELLRGEFLCYWEWGIAKVARPVRRHVNSEQGACETALATVVGIFVCGATGSAFPFEGHLGRDMRQEFGFGGVGFDNGKRRWFAGGSGKRDGVERRTAVCG